VMAGLTGDDLTRRIARIIEEGRPIYGDPNEQARRILALVLNEKKVRRARPDPDNVSPSGSASRASPRPSKAGHLPRREVRRSDARTP